MIHHTPTDNAAILQWLPLVKSRAVRYWRSVNYYVDLDDMISIGMEAVWYAERTWDKDRGRNFSTHVHTVLEHALLKVKTHILRPKRHSKDLTSMTVLDEETDEWVEREVPSHLPNPEEAARLAERAKLARRLIGKLPDRERRIILDYCDDETSASIGRDMGVSRERVRQLRELAIARMRRRAERTGEP